jgi:signal peptidase I
MKLRERAIGFLRTNKSFFIFFALMMVFRSAFADWMVVPSGSMNPTIVEGDRLLVDKNAFGWRVPFTTIRLTQGEDPQRNDIVIFTSPEDGMTLVKRVVGLPGDSIEMHDEHLLINGKPIEYSDAQIDSEIDPELPAATRQQDHQYVTEKLSDRSHEIMLLPNHTSAHSFGPIRVPDGQYLMLGDSRDNSKDSRYIGFVPRDNIFGRTRRVAYSLDAERWYRPRFDRVFSTLR